MSSRLRGLGLRVALLFALVAGAMAIRVTATKPLLPAALLQSFDRACALVEERVAKLERAAEQPAAPKVLATALDRFARSVADAQVAASARVETELAVASA